MPRSEPCDRHAGGPYEEHAGEPPYDRHPSDSVATAATVRRRAFLHGFRPGKLIAGLVLAGTAGAYAGDAAGAWHTPAYLALPTVFGGLLIAGAASWLSYRGRRRAARAASRENTAAPASASGSQATR
ncbi:hypothetical protein [Streptomyces sp. H27-C3]|uniref:hypothetical protein n=1 Tax=Streptomyces sp. H27-C3 TaxID=3046305 RepID=UPI0024BB0177|nr:hypothetical protein [Streptomyces sp. H27-C3]MDJ0466464.1 hypothetical protein [Streptomyces sp. H27-C3]